MSWSSYNSSSCIFHDVLQEVLTISYAFLVSRSFQPKYVEVRIGVVEKPHYEFLVEDIKPSTYQNDEVVQAMQWNPDHRSFTPADTSHFFGHENQNDSLWSWFLTGSSVTARS